MSAARCPRCATPTLVPGRDVHVCTRCGGVWLGAEASHRLLAPLGADLQHVQTQAPPLRCPVCNAAMHPCVTRLAGVEIDSCPAHGVWFDRHELEHVSQAVSRITGQPMPHAPASWTQAQPAAPAPGRGAGVGTGLAVGAAAVGAAAVGVAAYSALGGGDEESSRSSLEPMDALTYGPDVVNTGVEVSAAAGDAGGVVMDGAVSISESTGEAAEGASEAAGGVLDGVGEVAGNVLESAGEVAGEAGEAAGSVLGGIFEAIGSIFS